MKKQNAALSRPLLAAVFLVANSAAASAQAPVPAPLPAEAASGTPLPTDTVVASRGAATLTLAEIDAKVRTMPPELRAGYLTDPQRIARMVDSMLLSKQVAIEAEAQGYGEHADVQDDLALMRSEMLANRFISDRMNGVAEPNYETLAKERYLADPEGFRPAQRIDLRHILISTDGHDETWAKDLAQTVRDRVDAGEAFDKVIEDMRTRYPDSVKSDQLPDVDLKRLDPRFVAGLVAIKKEGDYAGPVRSSFGYHVIRLEKRFQPPVPTFDEVKDKLIAGLRNEFHVKERNRFLRERSVLDFQLNNDAVVTLPGRYAKAVQDSAGAAFAFGQPQGGEAESAGQDASQQRTD